MLSCVRTTLLTGFLKVPCSRQAQETLDSWFLICNEQWIPAEVSGSQEELGTLVAAGGIWLQTSTSRLHRAAASHRIWGEILPLSWSCSCEMSCLTASGNLRCKEGWKLEIAASPRGGILLRWEKERVWWEQWARKPSWKIQLAKVPHVCLLESICHLHGLVMRLQIGSVCQLGMIQNIPQQSRRSVT